jgi:hypothetical protein
MRMTAGGRGRYRIDTELLSRRRRRAGRLIALDECYYHHDRFPTAQMTAALRLATAMTDESSKSADESFYGRPPYDTAFDIGYPQENLEGEMYKYRCRFCKTLTTDINGRLENHSDDCQYRLQRMQELARTRAG